MERAENKRVPNNQERIETEPSLPSDPAEAAAWLQKVWQSSGGWKSQSPLYLKVSSPEDYQKLSGSEKREFHRLNSEFTWIAEMHASEMGWSQSYTRNNYGEIIGFRFGYEPLENPEDNTPQAYVYRPFNENEPKVFLSQRQSGWHVEPLDQAIADYYRNSDY